MSIRYGPVSWENGGTLDVSFDLTPYFKTGEVYSSHAITSLDTAIVTVGSDSEASGVISWRITAVAEGPGTMRLRYSGDSGSSGSIYCEVTVPEYLTA